MHHSPSLSHSVPLPLCMSFCLSPSLPPYVTMVLRSNVRRQSMQVDSTHCIWMYASVHQMKCNFIVCYHCVSWIRGKLMIYHSAEGNEISWKTFNNFPLEDTRVPCICAQCVCNPCMAYNMANIYASVKNLKYPFIQCTHFALQRHRIFRSHSNDTL